MPVYLVIQGQSTCRDLLLSAWKLVAWKYSPPSSGGLYTQPSTWRQKKKLFPSSQRSSRCMTTCMLYSICLMFSFSILFLRWNGIETFCSVALKMREHKVSEPVALSQQTWSINVYQLGLHISYTSQRTQVTGKESAEAQEALVFS